MEYTIIHKDLVGFEGVSAPVNLTKLTLSARNRSFANLSNCHGVPVKQRKFCSGCNKDVTDEDFSQKGFRCGKEMIKLDAALLKSIKERLDTTEIIVQEFRNKGEIPDIYYSELVMAGKPTKKGAKAYNEYAQVLAQAGKVAVGTIVVNSRPYPAMIEPRNGNLMVRGLLYPDEVKSAPDAEPCTEVNPEKVKLMARVIGMQKFPPYNHSQFKNERDEEEEKLIMAAASGQELPKIPAAPAKIQTADNDEIAKLKKLLGE